jgi:hypothetical protein
VAQSDSFRSQLLHRIDSYRESEARVDARLAELAGEKAAQAKRRGAAEDLFRAEFGEVPAPEPQARPAPQLDLTQSEEAQPPEGPLTGKSWEEAITAVLEETGPLHVKDIWQRLQDGGFRTDARDPLRSIVAVSVRSKPRIERVGANRYGLQGALDRREHNEGEGAAM